MPDHQSTGRHRPCEEVKRVRGRLPRQVIGRQAESTDRVNELQIAKKPHRAASCLVKLDWESQSCNVFSHYCQWRHGRRAYYRSQWTRNVDLTDLRAGAFSVLLRRLLAGSIAGTP